MSVRKVTPMSKSSLFFSTFCVLMIIIYATNAGPWFGIPIGVIGIVGAIYFDIIDRKK